MVAHLNIPSLEPSGKPTSLSSKVINDILRKEWGYDGLVLTDALNMKGLVSLLLWANWKLKHSKPVMIFYSLPWMCPKLRNNSSLPLKAVN